MKYEAIQANESTTYLIASCEHGRVIASAELATYAHAPANLAPFEATARLCSFVRANQGAWLRSARERARTMGPMVHYRAILAAARRYRAPVNYRADLLVHNRVQLSGRSNFLPFGYILRTNGTHIIDPLSDGCPRGFEWLASTFAPGSWCGDTMLFFWWNGATLERLENVEALVSALTMSRDDARKAVAAE